MEVEIAIKTAGIEIGLRVCVAAVARHGRWPAGPLTGAVAHTPHSPALHTCHSCHSAS